MLDGVSATNYFLNREDAGHILAGRLKKYRYENTIVLALSDGGVMVGASIAQSLHSLIAMLLTKDVFLPDGNTLVGAVNELGGFTYNNKFSAGQIEEFVTEYRNSIEAAKMNAIHELHVALGQGGLISPDYFRDRVVIVVADGSINGMAFEAAYNFLHLIHTKRIVMCAPICALDAVDRMHIIADELHVLNVTEGVFEVDHYYESNAMPSHHQIISVLNNIILSWKQEDQQKGHHHRRKAVHRTLLASESETQDQ